MEKPLVSIGIPTYNRPSGLRKSLEHITTQSYQNLEIIVSDNCSTCLEVKSVIEEFINKDSRIKYLRQEINKGAVFNFNFVREKATGNYFMWSADDDYFESSNLIEFMMNYSTFIVNKITSVLNLYLRKTWK